MKIKILTFLMMVCLVSCTKEREEIISDPPIIFHFYEEINEVGGNLTIVGANFSRHLENNIIEFAGGVTANPYSWKHGTQFNLDTLDVIIPEGAQTGTITIEVYSKRVVSRDQLSLLKGKFTQMASIPLERKDAVAFSLNGKGYVCTGSRRESGEIELNDLWEYDPNIDEWTKKGDFPGEPRRQAFSFVIEGKAYVGGGVSDYDDAHKDFYRYDSENDTWTELAEFPTWLSQDCAAFAINNKGYVVRKGINTSLVYQYDPVTDKWDEKESSTPRLLGSSSFVINNAGFVGLNTNPFHLYEYNPELDNWSDKGVMPFYVGYNAVGFTIGGRGYFANGSYNYQASYRSVFAYDQMNDGWIVETSFPGTSIGGACSFVIDDEAYIVGGESDNYTESNECWRFEVKD